MDAIAPMESKAEVVRGVNMQRVRAAQAAAAQPQQLARGGYAPHHETVGLRPHARLHMPCDGTIWRSADP